MSRQCGQCQCPDSPVSAKDSPMPENKIEMVDQPFAASEIGESMDLIAESHHDDTLAIVWGWIQSNSTPTWADCLRNCVAGGNR